MKAKCERCGGVATEKKEDLYHNSYKNKKGAVRIFKVSIAIDNPRPLCNTCMLWLFGTAKKIEDT